jgi:hypothetical protein
MFIHPLIEALPQKHRAVISELPLGIPVLVSCKELLPFIAAVIEADVYWDENIYPYLLCNLPLLDRVLISVLNEDTFYMRIPQQKEDVFRITHSTFPRIEKSVYPPKGVEIKPIKGTNVIEVVHLYSGIRLKKAVT